MTRTSADLAAESLVFEPLDGFEVEMVGGLVEHDQVVLTDERLGERDALGLAAGELVGSAAEQRLNAERRRHRGYFPRLAAFRPNTFRPAQILGDRARRKAGILVERGDADAAAEAHRALVG